MTLADILSPTLIILGFLVTLPALWLFLRALFPSVVERSRIRLEAAPVACFFLGSVPAVVLFVGGFLALQGGAPPVKGLGFLMVMTGFVLGGLGLAGLSSLIGDRLPSRADEGRPWRGLLRGAVCTELAFLLPVIGWFGLLPLALVTSLGAALLGMFAPASSSPPAPGAVPAVA